MKFKVGDKVRLTRDWCSARAGMEGELVCEDCAERDPFIRFPGWDRGHDGSLGNSKSLLPKGSTEGYYIPENNLELIPTEQEKPVVYEIGGTLTDANGVVHEITQLTVGGERVIIDGNPIRPVDPTHYIYTPPAKPVPMTKELQEKIEALIGMLPCHHRFREILDLGAGVRAAYQKAKESAK